MASTAPEFLRVARQLGPGRQGTPSDVRLRRCISTAYYAAFHALGDEVARPYKSEVRVAARRMLSHTNAADVARSLSQNGAPLLWLPGRQPCHTHLTNFANSFVRLQPARERADYDLAYKPTPNDAITALDDAQRVIDELKLARSACGDQLQAMCVAILAPQQTRRRMAR